MTCSLKWEKYFCSPGLAMRIHKIPMAGEVLDIATYENGAKGAHMQRIYEMKDASGTARVSIKSDWILVNPATGRFSGHPPLLQSPF